MLDLVEIESAAALVHSVLQPTAQFVWPLLCRRAGAEVWVKHENHTPTGAFKLRGGLVLLDRLQRERPALAGIVSATRGNHGQSLAWAARRFGLRTVVVVPEGNSVGKNAAMAAWGAELVEYGRDFDAARDHAALLARTEGLELIGPFRRELVAGVASYALEFFRAAGALDAVYVPVGCGSGICGLISVRDALGLATRIVGVVAQGANCYALSFAAGRPIETARADTIADGMAVRVPVPEALEVICRGAERIVEVSDAEIGAAMRYLFEDTHNLAEGAGAAPLAALLKEGARPGGRYGLILSGGNVDLGLFASVLA